MVSGVRGMTELVFKHLQVEETRSAFFIKFKSELLRDDGRLRDELFRLLDGDKSTLMVDLSNVKFISAAFLATIVKLQMELQKNNRRMKVYNLSPQIRDVFINSRLHRYLDIYDSADDAFQSLQMQHC